LGSLKEAPPGCSSNSDPDPNLNMNFLGQTLSRVLSKKRQKICQINDSNAEGNVIFFIIESKPYNWVVYVDAVVSNADI